MKHTYNQSGVALVVVLLVVALVSVIATDITGRLQYEMRRTGNIFDHLQAQQYALGAEEFAIAVLKQHIKDNPDRDDLSQVWAAQDLYFPVEGGDLTGTVTDLNQCFNLNSLVEESAEKGYIVNKESIAYLSYQRLLGLLQLPLGLSDSLVDWLDSDQQVTGSDGAEDIDYELLDPPYRAANSLMVDVNELRLVQGYNNDVMHKLMPYVCALPEASYLKLNLNTIETDKPHLLSMIIEGLSLDNASLILAERSPSGFDKLTEFWQSDALAGVEVKENEKSVLQLDSDYFMLKAKARIGRGRAGLTTMFKQVENKNIQVIWRRFGAVE